jgi:hypothetical protein
MFCFYRFCGYVSKSSRTEFACQILFDKMFKRAVVTWDARIVGYSQNGFNSEVLGIFHQLQMEGLNTNASTECDFQVIYAID